MIVTDFEWFDHRFQKWRKGYYMDEFLALNLMGVPDYLSKAWDVVGIVSGHCLSNNTRVKIMLKNGKIKDSLPLGKYSNGQVINTLSINLGTLKTEPSKSIVIKQPIRKIYKIKLSDGREIECTREHKLFVKRGEKIIELPLRLIKEGDRLICEKK